MRPRYIAYIILAFIAIIALSSCKAYKERICRECTTVNKDSVSTVERTIILYDTVKIAYPVQGPIQYLENPCKNLCDSLGRLKPFEIKKKTNGITGTIKSVGNSIVFDCKEDSLKYIIEKQLTTIKSFEDKQSTKTVQEDCKKEHTTKFTGFTFWWFWITLGIIVLWAIIKFFKGYLKAYLPFLK